MTTVLSPSGVELPDGGDPHSRAQVNRDFTKINDLWKQVGIIAPSTLLAGAAIPANTAYKRFSGPISVTTGAGGTSHSTANATDVNGVGSLWFGNDGLPTFQGIYSVHLTAYHTSSAFSYTICITSVDLSKIVYEAYRLNPYGAANYGSISIMVDILGW